MFYSEIIPTYIQVAFGLTVFLTLLLFNRALLIAGIRSRSTIIIAILVWIGLINVLSFFGFFSNPINSFPPRLFLAVGVTLLTLIVVFVSPKGRRFIDQLSPEALTWIHVVRIPVELVLYWLFLEKTVPELMTFAGRNFDIIAGITAPLVAYFGIRKKKMGRMGLIVWNFVCLGLLLFIVGNAILSAPIPIQQFGFEQPNIAIFNFPIVYLPTVVVPLVLFSHLATLRILLKKK